MTEDPLGASAGDPDWRTVEFLLQLRGDEADGHARPLRDYLGGDPGQQEAIAREYLLVRALDRRARASADGGLQFGRFLLQRELGRGGQGVVYEAVDRELARRVALKVLHRRPDGDLDLVRLQREVELVARVDHPAVARSLAAGSDAGCGWIAAEFIDGETLAAVLQQQRVEGTAMALPAAARLVALLAQGLHCAHGHGVLHRDVKPANIVLRADGSPVLTDFGLARAERSAAMLTESVELRGTPAYMAPELLALGVASARSDVWSLGAILFECLTGERPFAAPTVAATVQAVQQREVWSLPGFARLAGDVRAVLATALARVPDRRYASAADLARDCERLARGERPAARRPGWWRRLCAFAQHEPALATASAALVVVLLGGLAASQWVLHREQQLRAMVQLREQRVRSVARSMLFELHTAARDLPGAVALRQGMLERARDALAELHAAAPEDIGLLRELTAAWTSLGDVLGHDGVANRGDVAAAQRCYETAAELASAAIAGGDRSARVDLGTTVLRRADLAIEHPEIARPLYDQAIGLLDSDAPLAQALRASAYACIAQIERGSGRLPEALAAVTTAEALFVAVAAKERLRLGDVASTRFVRSTILVAMGEHDAARTLLQREAENLLVLRQQEPQNLQFLLRTAQCAIYRAEVEWADGDAASALALVELAVVLRRQRVAADPADIGAVHELALALHARARYRAATIGGEPQLVVADLREAAECAGKAGFAEFAAALRAEADAVR